MAPILKEEPHACGGVCGQCLWYVSGFKEAVTMTTLVTHILTKAMSGIWVVEEKDHGGRW